MSPSLGAQGLSGPLVPSLECWWGRQASQHPTRPLPCAIGPKKEREGGWKDGPLSTDSCLPPGLILTGRGAHPKPQGTGRPPPASQPQVALRPPGESRTPGATPPALAQAAPRAYCAARSCSLPPQVSWDKVLGVASLLSLGHALRLPGPDRVVSGLPCLPETPPGKPRSSQPHSRAGAGEHVPSRPPACFCHAPSAPGGRTAEGQPGWALRALRPS